MKKAKFYNHSRISAESSEYSRIPWFSRGFPKKKSESRRRHGAAVCAPCTARHRNGENSVEANGADSVYDA